MKRALVILLLCLGACLPSLALARAGMPARQVAAANLPSEPDCGCGGRCAMNACGCSAAPAEPAPTNREPVAPAPREGKGLVFGLDQPQQPIGFSAVGSGHSRQPVAEHAPCFSYDSLLCFVCVWRS